MSENPTLQANSKFPSLIRAVASRGGLKGLQNTSLYTNASYLVMDVAVVSIPGFAFWALVARLYILLKLGWHQPLLWLGSAGAKPE